MVMEKKGWIKIVEAFVAILLIAGVLLIVVSQGYFGKKDISSQVYDIEISVLREIQLNDSLRDDILNAETPIESDDDGFPQSIISKIDSRLPDYLDCKSKICWLNQSCDLEESPKKDVYAEAVAITTSLETPEEEQLKKLKLFCWGK